MRQCLVFLLLFFPALHGFSQENLVLNSNFEAVAGANGTKILSLNNAVHWQERNTADLYLRDSADGRGNVVRIAPHFNEVIMGTLKRKTVEGEAMSFQFDLLAEKRQKFKLELAFCPYPCDSAVETIPLAIAVKKKGWQTYRFDLKSSISAGTFSLISSSTSNKPFVVFIDNVQLLAKKQPQNNFTRSKEGTTLPE